MVEALIVVLAFVFELLEVRMLPVRMLAVQILEAQILALLLHVYYA
jgi:hypothetical protein